MDTMLYSLCRGAAWLFANPTPANGAPIRSARTRAPRSRSRCRPPRRGCTLRLEPLEDRCVLSPVLLDPNLGVRPVISGLSQPTGLAFLGDNDFLVLEKGTGRVQRVVNGVLAGTALDLAVNAGSERGLLGIALSPNFANDHNVYLYWTESTAVDANGNRTDTANLAETPLLGNRVDRFVWNGSTLTFDRNIIRLRALQPANPPLETQQRGNHDGGKIQFGPDSKLYIVIGDTGRRSWMQNLLSGPLGPGQADDQFGGPTPDDAHLTGVVLRLNPDGSTPTDNPFRSIRNTLVTTLTGANERPNPNTTTATGSVVAFLNQAMDQLTVTFTFQGLSAPTNAGGAHIHIGAANVAGPIILPFRAFPAGLTSGTFTTTFTAATFTPQPQLGISTFSDAVNAILQGNTYFNVHTSRFPGGEIRGQLALADPQVTANLHKVFAYGVRNSFGMDFDPVTGSLWLQENGDDSFDRVSRMTAGSNNGWIQTMAPIERIREFKGIETSPRFNGLQQNRWPATNIADTPQQALQRLVMLPGAHYNPPEFSLRYAAPHAGIGFLNSSALGAEYEGDLFLGSALSSTNPQVALAGGFLMRLQLNSQRTGFDFGGNPHIVDKVFENFDKQTINGDQSLLAGMNFGIGSEVRTAPNGNLYVVSLTGSPTDASPSGTVYEIFRKSNVSSFQTMNLVSDLASPAGGAPLIVDASLKNPWGIAFGPTTPFWVANQATGVSTLYSGDVMQADGSRSPFTKLAMTITIPPVAGGTQGSPTGVAFNGTTDFVVGAGPGRFIFASLDGTIAAWNNAIGTTARTVATTPGAVYTGLTLGSNAGGNFLYAANVRQNRIDVFDKNFARVTLAGSFFDEDPAMANFTPFNIQNINGTLYVAYENRLDRERGGVINAFDTNGNLLRRVVTGGLNAPWGMTLAPAGFGRFGGALLVGNFGLGDGKINAYNPDTGANLGYVTDATGSPLAFERLWALAFGNGGNGGDRNTLYFVAGINNEMNGLFGSIRFGTSSPAAPSSRRSPSEEAGVAPDANLVAGLQLSISILQPAVPARPTGELLREKARPMVEEGAGVDLLFATLADDSTPTAAHPRAATPAQDSEEILVDFFREDSFLV